MSLQKTTIGPQPRRLFPLYIYNSNISYCCSYCSFSELYNLLIVQQWDSFDSYATIAGELHNIQLHHHNLRNRIPIH